MPRININVADELLSEIDAYAKSLHITRTAAISVLCSNALQGIRSVGAMESMMKAYQEETAKQKQLPK